MTVSKQNLQFGLWPSPIKPESLARGNRLGGVAWDDRTGALVWLEERSGHGVLMCQIGDEAPRDLTDSIPVRARVGYGGGDFAVRSGAAFFVERESGRIFRQELLQGDAKPITPAFGRAAAPSVSPDGRWVVYVHAYEGVDRLAIVDSNGQLWPSILAGGHDFFMQPVWRSDGNRIAWVAWDQPNMPWDGSTVFVADLEIGDGSVSPRATEIRAVAGGESESVFQPEFHPSDDVLFYVSDRSGWWSLVARQISTGEEREFGFDRGEMGLPGWIQGYRTYALSPDGDRAFVAVNRDASIRGYWLDFASGRFEPLTGLDDYRDVEFPAIDPISRRLACIASSPVTPARVLLVDPSGAASRVVRRTSSESVPASALSEPEPFSWTSFDGRPAYGLYYPPASDRYTSSGKPPLVVIAHGGPTSQVVALYSAQGQFLATRGYGVLFVNYRGSTGYGREYAQALRGMWGVYDVEDSVTGAQALAAAGRVDPDRMAIMGGSAGGFTVLQTMIVHPDAFTVGVCLYGVANQFTLAAETHKFEARYTDQLIGPLPEASALYRERSPQYRASEIRRPIAIFQGEIDEVVLKNQSDVIVEALRRSGVPHEYHVYAGEGHGWRKAETIASFYTSLDRFLKQYLIFS